MKIVDEILNTWPRRTWAERQDIAREVIRQTGDLPWWVWYELWLRATDIDPLKAARLLNRMRPKGTSAHKAKP